ncbi:MAG: hypothetical protein A3G34_09455 [Candidatus Lindowbacteria bacterium RIFCSPLOWO2_12_FULL_62_27]|nr:MAG: hypothetical protein A3G34_09455 [Candidatus Lindowbacteria bacterium RIFCSPLOWO2_12_FULL_62_27]
MNPVSALAAAELKVECRNPSGVVSAAMFSCLALLAQALVLPGVVAARPEAAFAACFIAVFFSVLLAETGRMARESKTGTPFVLALSPACSPALFAGKSAVPFGFMMLVEACMAPLLIVFFNLPVRGPWWAVALLAALVNLSLAGLTTLLGAAASSWKGVARAVSLPLLVLPLALPVLATAVVGAARAMAHDPFGAHLRLLLASALAIWTVGMATYGKLLGRY